MRKSLTPLGESEMEILHIVWSKQKVSVAEVHEEILKTRKVAYTTVMTIMKKLADKGYLTFIKDGVTYIYSPAQPESEVKHGLLKQIVNKVFKGSPLEMVQSLVDNEELSQEERLKIEEIISKMNR